MNKRIVLLWLPMTLIAFANATIRELVFVKMFSQLHASQLSTFTLILFCALYTWLIWSVLKISSSGEALRAGLIWMILTILFEFLLGWLLNQSWESMLQNYNLPAGNIWPLFLLALFFMPIAVFRLKK